MVSLKGSYLVKPAEETPKGLMSLSDFDLIAPRTHAPLIYFYQNPSLNLESATYILKDSLSKALVIFYPLAGRLHSIGGGRFELHCNSLGAQLLVAESQAKIDDFGDFSPTPQIRALSPPVDYNTAMHELPLLLVQITKLRCGGISLGVLISRILVDGPSAMHFIDVWTKIARGEQSTIDPPFLDRTILRTKKSSPPPHYDHREYNPPPLLIGSSDSLEEGKKETTVATIRLSKDQISKLKQKANESRTSDHSNRPYTTFEVVAGHMWRCASKARKHASEQPTMLYIITNARNRMKPWLPRHYFGNAITRVAAEATSGDLVSKPLSYATSKVRKAIERLTDEYVRSSLRYLRSKEDVTQYHTSHSLGCTKTIFQGNPNLSITSWTRLPLYGVDFGWGKEIHMGPGAIGADGNSFIVPGGDEDGSITIPVRLQVAHMEAFKNYLYDEILQSCFPMASKI